MIDLQTEFRKTLRKLGIGSGVYLIAVSGGIDSVVLLDLVIESAADFNLTPIVVHVHHHLRGEEADRDEQFVSELAKRLGVDYVRLDVYPQTGTENELRKLRYEALEQELRKRSARGCLLGHTGSDLVETVFMRLSEGAGVRGLAGIPQVHGRFFRPLLFATRDDIVAYAQTRKLAWLEDSMNRNMRYKRVRARQIVVPAFRQAFGESAIRAVLDSARFCQEAYEALKALLPLEGFRTAHGWDIQKIVDLPQAAQPVAVKLILEHELNGISPRRPLVLRTLSLIHSSNPHAWARLDNQLFAIKLYGELEFSQTPPVETPQWQIQIDKFGTYDLPEGQLEVFEAETALTENPFTAILPKELVRFPLIARSRREGDRIVRRGHTTPRKLKRILIDAKIPLAVRKLLPVLELCGRVVFVPPVAHSVDTKPAATPGDIVCKFKPSRKLQILLTRGFNKSQK